MRPSTIRRLTRCPWLLRESGETAGEWGQWRTSRQPRWMGERGCLKRLYALYALFTVVRARRVEEDGSERRGPVVRLVSDTARQTAARSSPTPRASSPVGLSRPSRVPAICLRLPLTSYCTSVYYLSLGLSHNLVPQRVSHVYRYPALCSWYLPCLQHAPSLGNPMSSEFPASSILRHECHSGRQIWYMLRTRQRYAIYI